MREFVRDCETLSGFGVISVHANHRLVCASGQQPRDLAQIARPQRDAGGANDAINRNRRGLHSMLLK
jgi:hypothetical protein